MKDFFVNVISSLLIAAAGWAFNRYALGNGGSGSAEFWSILAVAVLVGALMLTLRLNRLRTLFRRYGFQGMERQALQDFFQTT